jgi:hypothetical protein
MTAFLLITASIGVVLTLWLIAIPAEILVGTFTAFRHEGHGGKGWKK